MENQTEENLELCSNDQLKQLIKNIQDEIKQMEQKILPIKSEQMKRKLIDLLNLSNEDLTNVTNFEVFCKIDKSHSENDEYAHTFKGELKISYDYDIGQPKKVSVSLEATYLEEQTYYNHHDPDITTMSDVTVTGANEAEYEYFDNLEVNRVNDEGDEIECNNTEWNYLINQVLKQINEEPTNWFSLMDNIVV